jgi:CubicO group peptidase (beta-lactamase class C family)
MGAASTPIVGLTALQLAHEGKLDLSRSVRDYVPLELAAGFDPTRISVNQLLLHTAGLPESHSGLSCETGPSTWFATNHEPLWAPPGSVANFSHIGYAAAGWVIGAASGQSFADAAAQRVFGPTKMKTATYDATTAFATNHAVGQDVDTSGQVTPEPGFQECPLFLPVDGLYASVLDYASFAESVFAGGGPGLDAQVVTTFETGQTNDYLAPGDQLAFGMYQHEAFQGVTVLNCGGSAGGFRTELFLAPKQRFAVAVFFNADNSSEPCSTYKTAVFALETYMGLGTSSEPNQSTPPSAWTPYLGTYVDPVALGTIVIGLDGDQLMAADSRYGSIALTQSSATAFHATYGSDPSVIVTFQPDDRGPAGWFVTPYGVGRRQ